MKYLKWLVVLVAIVVFASCKKTNVFVFTQADLIGTWHEDTPCIFSPNCYMLVFKANDTLICYQPYYNFDSLATLYQLSSNNILQIQDTLAYGATFYGPSYYEPYHLSGNANSFTIADFYYVTANQFGTGPSYTLHLTKTN